MQVIHFSIFLHYCVIWVETVNTAYLYCIAKSEMSPFLALSCIFIIDIKYIYFRYIDNFDKFSNYPYFLLLKNKLILALINSYKCKNNSFSVLH